MKKTKKRGLTILVILVLIISIAVLLWRTLERVQGTQSYTQALQAAGIDGTAAVPDDAPEDVITDPYAAMLAQIDLAALRETNRDVIAWVDIPGTELSYPVLQAEDNQYYLNHTWQNGRNPIGAIFMECTCSPDFGDFHTILYGHRMNNDSMFGTLKYYKTQDFWSEHPNIYVVDDAGVYVYDIFAAHEVSIKEIVYRLDIEENDLEEELIRYCVNDSVIDTGIVPEATDKILTLSTCTGNGHDTRWVIHGTLVQVYSQQTA